jgi:uncharacterized membrane protein
MMESTRQEGGEGSSTFQQALVGLARRRPHPYSPVGLVVAVGFFWVSLSPGLLPRDAVFQGLVSGLSTVVGYALGVVGLALARFMVERPLAWTPRGRVLQVLIGLLVVGTVAAFVGYRNWQDELRTLMGTDKASPWQPVVILVLTVVVFVLLVAAGRLVRRGTRWLVRKITRVLPPRVAMVAGCALVVVLMVGVLDGVVGDAFVSTMDSSFRLLDQETNEGDEPPQAAALSGSPGSLVRWDSLGRQGRAFVANATSVQELGEFNGGPAMQPVRAYVGLDAAGSIAAEARLAARELERAGGFDRAVIYVVTSTGTGWINEDAADALEFLYNGDTAIVSMQYSYLPSWMSFVVDQARAREAGRQLFNAVYARWEDLPEDDRPKLVVGGESLGSFGAESAFSGVEDLRARTDGALFVGPPFMNDLWVDITEHRDAGSPQWLPIYENGRTVRFVARPADLDRPDAPWPDPRVVYLQYASDPITWWNPDLLFHRPDWLKEERGYDVLPGMSWFPVVTFLQLSADMAVGHNAPNGHGHRFGADPADAWAAILHPDGWTAADTARLHELIAERSEERRGG